MYTQAWAFWNWSFKDFATINKFLCVQICPIDSNVKLPHILGFFIPYIEKKLAKYSNCKSLWEAQVVLAKLSYVQYCIKLYGKLKFQDLKHWQ